MGAEFLGDLKEDFSHEFSSTLVWKPDLSRLVEAADKSATKRSAARRRADPPSKRSVARSVRQLRYLKKGLGRIPGEGVPGHQFLDSANRLQTGFVSNLQEFVRASGFVPANVADFWRDNEIGIAALLFGNDTLHGDKGLGKHSECRTGVIYEPGAVRAYIDRYYDIGSQFARITDRKVRNQTAVDQQSTIPITHWNIQGRQAAAGANGKGDIAVATQSYWQARTQVGYHCRKRNLELFETRYRKPGAQELFHACI